jgi:ribosomal-protein-alanine N-acetyltransferase
MFSIATGRLLLRDLSVADLEAVHQLNSLPETDRYNTLGIPENIEVTRKVLDGWLESKEQAPRPGYVLLIEDKINGAFIGVTALVLGKPKRLSAEVWYNLHKDHWNNGYATEALKALLDLGFNTLKLHRIEAGCAVENVGSARVMEKAGMVKEGCKRKNLPLKDGWSDGYSYAILEEDFYRTS